MKHTYSPEFAKGLPWLAFRDYDGAKLGSIVCDAQSTLSDFLANERNHFTQGKERRFSLDEMEVRLWPIMLLEKDRIEMLWMQRNDKGEFVHRKGTQIPVPVPAVAEKVFTPQIPVPVLCRPTVAKGATVEMERLVSCLSSLGFRVEAGEEHKGPTVTRYEVKPHPTVRVESLCRVGQSIAVALAAHSVRIVGCIPGKGTVGIEVATKDRKTVSLDSVGVGVGALRFALGVEVGGDAVCPDLADMPHLLIAGSTGSGKSVCLSALLCSLVQRQGPDSLRLLLVDPKQVELCAFSSLPHLLCPIITKADKAVTALDWLTREMGKRYGLFASLGVKNIAGWNAKSRKEDKLPRIVVVIDELADLMIAAKGETEDVIGRLSALARASGIHLVVATQRPSVNVVTGLIKANLPSRIAFRVTSQVDSRVILDTKGAEALVGKGDALFVQPGQMEPLRVQCCFVSDEQIERIVEKAGEGLTQTFVEGVETAIACDSSQSEADGGSEPVLFSIDRAMTVLRDNGYAQTKLLASACRWPVETAQACIDEMERREIVGKGSPEATREILVTLDY